MSRPLSRRHSRTSTRASVQDVALLFASAPSPAPAPAKRKSRHERHASLAGADDLASVVPGTYSSADQRRSLRLSRTSVPSASVLFASFGQDLFALNPAECDGDGDGDRQSALDKLEGRSNRSSLADAIPAPLPQPPLTPALHTLVEEDEEEEDPICMAPPQPRRSRPGHRSGQDHDAALTQMTELQTRLERSEKQQAVRTASWDKERASMAARIQSLEGRLAQALAAQESSKSATSQLEEQLVLAQRERDEYVDDISGWRQRCSELEAKLASETERADTQSRIRAGLAAKAVRMTSFLPVGNDMELTPEELSPALVSIPRRCEWPSSIPVGPSPEATVQLLGAMRQQIISLARTLAQERAEHAQAISQAQAVAQASPQVNAPAHSPLLGSTMRTRRTSRLTASTASSSEGGLSISTAPTSRGGSTSSFFEPKSDDTVVLPFHEEEPVPAPVPREQDFDPMWSFASAVVHPLEKGGIFPLPGSEGQDFFQLGTELTLPPLSWTAKDLPPLEPRPESLLSLTSQALSGLGGYLFSSTPSTVSAVPHRTIPRMAGRPLAHASSSSGAENMVFV